MDPVLQYRGGLRGLGVLRVRDDRTAGDGHGAILLRGEEQGRGAEMAGRSADHPEQAEAVAEQLRGRDGVLHRGRVGLHKHRIHTGGMAGS